MQMKMSLDQIGNYQKARSACIVIKILWIKLKYDLILNSPNLTVHVSKKRDFVGIKHKRIKWYTIKQYKYNYKYKSLLHQPNRLISETKEIELNYLPWVFAGRDSIRSYFNFIHKILITMRALRAYL